jgi:hypothetical protein
LVRSAVLEEWRVLFIGIRERGKACGRSRRRSKTINSLLLAADVSARQPLKVGGAVALGTGIHWGTKLKEGLGFNFFRNYSTDIP